jgi:hypothetical protein
MTGSADNRDERSNAARVSEEKKMEGVKNFLDKKGKRWHRDKKRTGEKKCLDKGEVKGRVRGKSSRVQGKVKERGQWNEEPLLPCNR